MFVPVVNLVQQWQSVCNGTMHTIVTINKLNLGGKEMENYTWDGEIVTKEEYDKLYEEYLTNWSIQEDNRLNALDAVDYMDSRIKSDIRYCKEILNDSEFYEDEKEDAKRDIEFLNKMLKYVYKIQMENACQDC